MSEWQPIETAPKDGERDSFLVFAKGQVWLVCGNSDEYMYPKDNGCGCCAQRIFGATHWMPCPEEPQP